METAVGFLGGGMAVAGAVTVWNQARRARRTSFRFGISLIVGGLALIALALLLVAGPLQRSKAKPSAPAATAPAVKPPAAVDPWANPDIPAIREKVRSAYAEYEAVLARATHEVKPELLDQVATGDQLSLLKESIRSAQDKGFVLEPDVEATVWAITPTPSLRNVSVQVKGTFRTWNVDAKTGQRVGEPFVKRGEQLASFVWSDGRWKLDNTVFFAE